MCNACGFQCCAWDGLEGCGCQCDDGYWPEDDPDYCDVCGGSHASAVPVETVNVGRYL